jgi:hypothetical protein
MTSGSVSRASASAGAGRAGPGERLLRQAVREQPGLTVLTGGQTGVDSYAARAALEAGLAVHLVFPRGYRQEDGPLTATRRRRLVGASMHELSSASFRNRTWTCAYLADAILLIDPAGGSGCREITRAAGSLGRPLLRPGPAGLTAAQAASWLAGNDVRVLMVAGCRASVLASKGKGRGLRTQLAAIMAGARAYHDQRVAADTEGGGQ